MTATLPTSAGDFPVRLASATPLLCLPKAKTPRYVGQWAEVDGLEYDLSEPIWLEDAPLTLHIQAPVTLHPAERHTLYVFGREVTLAIRHVTPHLAFEGWDEIQAVIAYPDQLFGSGDVSAGVFTEDELQGLGIRIAPDWEALRRTPERKVAYEAVSKHADGKRAPLAPGLKERTIILDTWSHGADCVSQHLALCALLRARTAGLWRLGGRDYYLRYQSMELTAYLPAALVASRLTLQQYTY